jgi:hypothetical protein
MMRSSGRGHTVVNVEGDPVPAQRPSIRHIAIGLAAVGVRGMETATRAGWRAAVIVGRPLGATWDSRVAAGPRAALAAPVTRLATLGERTEAQARQDAGSQLAGAVEGILTNRLVAETVADVLSRGVVDRVAIQVIESPEFERAVVAGLDSPALEELVARIVQSPGLERALTRVLESELVDELSDRLLASEEVHRWVGQIAQSDEVRAALTQQSMGLVDEVAGAMRARTVSADAVAERVARSVLRRKPAPWSRPPPMLPERSDRE